MDPPHSGKVTSLSFQPPPPHTSSTSSSKSTGAAPRPRLLAVSTGEDGKFKSWVLVGGGDERGVVSWACLSVGYYQSLPCSGACFSSDGSLLATNFKKVSHSPAILVHTVVSGVTSFSVLLYGTLTPVNYAEHLAVLSLQKHSRESGGGAV